MLCELKVDLLEAAAVSFKVLSHYWNFVTNGLNYTTKQKGEGSSFVQGERYC